MERMKTRSPKNSSRWPGRRISSPTETLQRIVDLTVQQMPDARTAAISLVYPGGRIVHPPAATDQAARAVDASSTKPDRTRVWTLTANTVHRGSGTGGSPARVRQPGGDERASTACSVRLFVQEDTGGALNLDSREVGRFRRLGTVPSGRSGGPCGAAMSNATADTREGLQVALEGSRVIGLAIGMLMEQC